MDFVNDGILNDSGCVVIVVGGSEADAIGNAIKVNSPASFVCARAVEKFFSSLLVAESMDPATDAD